MCGDLNKNGCYRVILECLGSVIRRYGCFGASVSLEWALELQMPKPNPMSSSLPSDNLILDP